jgi:hypothetical protein
VFAVSLLIGCSTDEFTGAPASNQPPQVWLTSAPPEGSTVHYQVHMFWGGFDGDGKISHFEFAITDNGGGAFDPADTTGADKWQRTEVGDSVFIVTADSLADSSHVDFEDMAPYEFQRSHTFFIRAVDNRGSRSKAVYRSFTARTLSPTITIDIPRPTGVNIAIVPPLITFHWTARDYIDQMENQQDPDSVRSILVNTAHFNSDDALALDYIRSNPDAPEWTEWEYYSAPGDSGRFWHSDIPLAIGRYIFAVQAMDEAGAVSPVFDREKNVRHIRVDDRTTGPVMTLESVHLRDAVRSSSSKTPPTVLSIPASLPLTFEWSADASSYGGVVTGYRYGWDISELSDDDQWDIDYTPFIGATAKSPSRTFYFGVHTFHVEARDNSGFISRITLTVNVVPAPMDRSLLVIDDWQEGEGASFARNQGAGPGDEEHDAFWGEVLSDLDDFGVERDTYPPHGRPRKLPLAILLRYKTVIWNARGDPVSTPTWTPLLADIIAYNSPEPNLLKMYLLVGGKVLICGDHAMTMVLDKSLFPDLGPFQTGPGPGYPVILRYELDGDQFGHWEEDGMEIGVRGVGDDSFGYKDLCLNVLDITWGIHFNKGRRFCRVKLARTYRSETEGLRTALPIDTRYDFPRLDLRPEVAGPGKFYHVSKLGIRSDIFNPPYFQDICGNYAELIPRRRCFRPIYALKCKDPDARINGAPIAYWLTRYSKMENPYGVAARSAVFGFTPVFFNPHEVREALNIILFDEWKLQRKAAPAN